ncbi:MAG: nicotinate-nicotinamide nucleotide adenylyltransferase [Planctomycetota bacterium]
MARKITEPGIRALQAEVNATFSAAFGRTPLKERLDDVLRMAIRTSRFSDLENLKEDTGDLLNSVLQLCNECGWNANELSARNQAKIERRMAQYQSLGRKLKVAIFGGAFDPITMGHIKNAQLVLNCSKEFDEVWIMPCYQHLNGKNMMSPEARYEMCRLAAQTDGRLKVSPYEIDKKFAGETYHLVKMLLSDSTLMDRCDFSIIIGLDNAKTFDKWINYEFLERQIRFITVARPGVDEDPKVSWYRKPPHIYLQPEADEDLIKISSTEVRKMLKSNDLSVSKYLSPGVLAYIREHRLYGI